MGVLSSFIEFNRRICVRLEARFPNCFDVLTAGSTYLPEVRSQLEPFTTSDSGARILEVGGANRPLIERGNAYEYIGLDIEERPRSREVYDDFIVQSVEARIEGEFDVVFSITLLEHVRDNAAATRSMFGALKPGGEAINYIPNKGHPYALILRLVGNRVQRRLLEFLEGAETKGGYPTHFDACTPRQMKRLFEEAGFTEIRTVLYYSPTKYFLAFVPAYIFTAGFMQLCRVLGLSYFCSGFVILSPQAGLRRSKALQVPSRSNGVQTTAGSCSSKTANR